MIPIIAKTLDLGVHTFPSCEHPAISEIKNPFLYQIRYGGYLSVM